MAIGLVVGIGLLVACELKIAREYAQTANAMDAAGIAILFATVFASFALWHLVPPTVAFGLLTLVTGVAVSMSIGATRCSSRCSASLAALRRR